jgi:DNA-binding transcriptional ArsR family regulator
VAPDDPASLPDGARRLLLGPVDSFEKLEVLLILHETAGSAMPIEALAARVGVAAGQAERAAAELAASGLLERRPDGTWRIAASADAQALAELATAWATCRAAVLKTLTGRAVGRIRASAARVFADAFRLRKRDGGEGDG